MPFINPRRKISASRGCPLFKPTPPALVTDLIEGAAQGVLQGQVLRLQAGVEALQLLQAGAHDVHDGGLDGAHGRGQLHVELHHLGLVSVQRPVHRRLEPGRDGARGVGGDEASISL